MSKPIKYGIKINLSIEVKQKKNSEEKKIWNYHKLIDSRLISQKIKPKQQLFDFIKNKLRYKEKQQQLQKIKIQKKMKQLKLIIICWNVWIIWSLFSEFDGN